MNASKTSISVSKQSVKELLSSGKDKPFVIPEYQRPYSWSIDEASVLFEDLWNFTVAKGGSEKDAYYFLGSVVSYENDNNEKEIIDGQQRITTLFLLLRAIYTHLQQIPKGEESDKSRHAISSIEPTIWKTDKLTGQVQFDRILLSSKVVTDINGNGILLNILSKGRVDAGSDNYSKCYLLFQELLKKHSSENPFLVFEFIYAVLNQAIFLPITAESQDTALTIFSTLNNRGLALSDADIFKAKIYNDLSGGRRKDFIQAWKDLEENSSVVGETMQSLFYYHMFVLRAEDNDSNTTTPGARKYYLEKSDRLLQSNLMDRLNIILELLTAVNCRKKIAYTNEDTIKSLDVLSSYPNEFWKYPVIIYYLKHRETNGFIERFNQFLKKLAIELLIKYLITPSISAVKGDILKLNIEVSRELSSDINFTKIDDTESINEKLKYPHPKIVRMLLKLFAYQKQEDLLPVACEIEHIFPKKWDNSVFTYSQQEIEEQLEMLGNKVLLEKKLNIRASNNYFSKKKDIYSSSSISMAKELASSYRSWDLKTIEDRNITLLNEFWEIYKKPF